MAFQVENYTQVKNKLEAYKATLVAVSKKKPLEDILQAIENKQFHFGENYVQELVEKNEMLQSKAKWHFIGHLQSNKVKMIAPFVHLIQSVDSFKLLNEINKEANKNNRIIDCLLQVHIASEETKFGFSEEETEAMMSSLELSQLANIRIQGLMGMASFTEETSHIKEEFSGLKNLFDTCKLMSADPEKFNILSMGMSSDYEIALDCGSSMIRMGSTLFGERNKL